MISCHLLEVSLNHATLCIFEKGISLHLLLAYKNQYILLAYENQYTVDSA